MVLRRLLCSVLLGLALTPPGVAANSSDDRIRTLIAEAIQFSAPAVRQFDLALVRCQEADRLAANSADMSLRTTARFQLARALFNTERSEESIVIGRDAARMAQAAGAFGMAGNALRVVGGSLITTGRFEEAEHALKEAAELSAQYGTEEEAAAALNNLAVNANYQGRMGEGLEFARQALAMIDGAIAKGVAIGPRMQFAAPFNVGKALAEGGDYMDSRPYLERAFAAAERNGDIGGQMHVLFDTGEWYEAQGDLDRAERYYRRSVEFTKIHPSGEGEGKGHRGLGRVMLATGRVAEAIASFTAAIDAFEAGQSLFRVPPTLVDRARAKAAHGDREGSTADLDRAIDVAARQNHRTALVLGLIERGHQRLKMGLLEESRSDFETATVRAARDRLIPLLPAAWAGQAAVAETSGDLAAALALYETAAETLERIRGRIVSLELRASFSSSTYDTFAGMVRVLMALHAANPSQGYDERAFGVLERQRSQSLDLALIEARAVRASGTAPSTDARIAHIQNALFAPDLDGNRRQALMQALDDAERDLSLAEVSATNRSSTSYPNRLPKVADLQRALSHGDVVVEYTTNAAFVVTATSMQLVPIDMPPDLAPRVAFFVSALESNARDASIASGRILTIRLLDPVLALVPTGARLMIVASGALGRLPFAALPVRDPGGRVVPLLAVHELTYLPSLTTFEQRRASPAGALPRRVLAVADAHSDDDRAQSLAALPGSRTEARFAAQIMPDARVMMAADATESAVKLAAADGYSVVHLATHALLDSRVPGRSAVLLGRSNGDDGLLQSREIYQLPLKGALIVLSGCRTADGRFSAAEGLLSLSRAFLQAGGRTVVGSLWDLPDDSAASMMMRFYTSLDSGRSAGAALRAAQLAQAGANPYASSRTWAAMVMMGDPSVTLAAGPTTAVVLVPVAVVGSMLGWLVFAFARRAVAAR